MTPEERTLLRRLIAVYRTLPEDTRGERRRSVSDRRRSHTYLASDRRSGVVDRRFKIPPLPSMLDVLKRRQARNGRTK